MTRTITLAKTTSMVETNLSPFEDNRFADHVPISLHCLQVCLNKFYYNALGLLSEMIQSIREVSLEEPILGTSQLTSDTDQRYRTLSSEG